MRRILALAVVLAVSFSAQVQAQSQHRHQQSQVTVVMIPAPQMQQSQGYQTFPGIPMNQTNPAYLYGVAPLYPGYGYGPAAGMPAEQQPGMWSPPSVMVPGFNGYDSVGINCRQYTKAQFLVGGYVQNGVLVGAQMREIYGLKCFNPNTGVWTYR